MKMSITARWPSMPSRSKTMTPTSMVAITDRIGVSTTIRRLGSGRFSSLMRIGQLRTCGAAVDAAHEEADLVDVGLRHLHRLAQASSVDHRQRIAERQQLIEVLADDHDGRA